MTDPEYGRSPALDALDAAREWNKLDPETRAAAGAAFVRRRLLRAEFPGFTDEQIIAGLTTPACGETR